MAGPDAAGAPGAACGAAADPGVACGAAGRAGGPASDGCPASSSAGHWGLARWGRGRRSLSNEFRLNIGFNGLLLGSEPAYLAGGPGFASQSGHLFILNLSNWRFMEKPISNSGRRFLLLLIVS